jgi:RNA polymerase sigma-70 factor (ECF subfamily)
MVFNLYVFENKSHREIASLLGIKEKSSASQLCRAKNLLAKMIRQYNDK